jgi:hypothetical protein
MNDVAATRAIDPNGYELQHSRQALDIISTHTSIDSSLDLLDKICRRSVTASSPRWTGTCSLTLYDHQRALLGEMREREHILRSGATVPASSGATVPASSGSEVSTSNPETKDIFYSRYAFLGDGSATGKSWTAVAYMAACKAQPLNAPTAYLHQLSQLYTFSVRKKPSALGEHNLVIVPSAQMSQWTRLLERQDDLHVYIVKKRSVFQADDFMDRVRRADVTLVSSTNYADLAQKALENQFLWTRCFIDDWQQISLPIQRTTVMAEFTWLLTQSWVYYLLYNSEYLNNIIFNNLFIDIPPHLHGDVGQYLNLMTSGIGYPASQSIFNSFVTNHPNRDLLVVRSTYEFLSKSIAVKPAKNTYVFYCGDPIVRFLLAPHSSNLRRILALGDYVKALNMVGATILSEAEWPRSKETLIRRANFTMDDCPICYEKPTMPTITGCCQTAFCVHCLFSTCQISGTNHCPMCRSSIHGTKLTTIHTLLPEPAKPFPKKMDVLIQEITNRPNGRHLLYFPAEAMYGQLRAALKEAHINCSVATGTREQITRKLDNFRNGRTDVLIVFNRAHILHMDLPEVTTIFIYPDTVQEIDKSRLVLNTQCIGRKEPLEVIQFINHDEVLELAPVAAPMAGPIGSENTSLGASL